MIEPKTQDVDIPKETIAVSTQTSFPSLSATGEGYSGSQSSEDSDEGITDKGLGNIDTISLGKSHSSKLSDRFRKTLRLSSTQIVSFFAYFIIHFITSIHFFFLIFRLA